MLTLLGTAAAAGQSQSCKATVSFEFAVSGGTKVPAGTYLVSYAPGSSTVTLNGGSGQRLVVPVITRLRGQLRFGDANLVFDDSGSAPILSEIWLPGQDGLLVHSMKGSHGHRSVVAAVSGSASGSGKQIFEKTCVSCHGPKGAGSEAADRFFSMTIPRLVSEAVQSKSDAEFREIISQGRRNMDAVRAGQSGMRHLLAPESVDAVIAYVRTLKK